MFVKFMYFNLYDDTVLNKSDGKGEWDFSTSFAVNKFSRNEGNIDPRAVSNQVK